MASAGTQGFTAKRRKRTINKYAHIADIPVDVFLEVRNYSHICILISSWLAFTGCDLLVSSRSVAAVPSFTPFSQDNVAPFLREYVGSGEEKYEEPSTTAQGA